MSTAATRDSRDAMRDLHAFEVSFWSDRGTVGKQRRTVRI